MTANDSFSVLMERFRSDENAAARDVFQRFSRQLIAPTRRQFAHRLAHRIDPEDVVQSVFKSFFARHRDGKFQIGNWNNLWGLLTLITRRKCADRVEYFQAERRDIGREASAPEGPEQFGQLTPNREPLPEEAAILADMVESLFREAAPDRNKSHSRPQWSQERMHGSGSKKCSASPGRIGCLSDTIRDYPRLL